MKVKELLKAAGGLLKEELDYTGVIEHTEDIFATYYLENDNVKSIQMFATLNVSLELDVQVAHTVDLIKVAQAYMINLCNLEQKEANDLLNALGVFNGKFKQGIQVMVYDYLFKVETQDGLFLFTIFEL